MMLIFMFLNTTSVNYVYFANETHISGLRHASTAREHGLVHYLNCVVILIACFQENIDVLAVSRQILLLALNTFAFAGSSLLSMRGFSHISSIILKSSNYFKVILI